MLVVLLACPAVAQERVAETVHNLSAGGPGTVRAATEGQVCIFCHAPHNTAGERPLWNRELPMTNYSIYESSTLDANLGQPTGTSKLCLSCHDGTIALGAVLSRADRIQMLGGNMIPAGLTNLGTDLSDDHPISFNYTAGLAASDRQLASPSVLGPEVTLDANGQLQCASCHDVHHNRFGNFLVMSNEFGALCTECHVRDGWEACSHRLSGVSVDGTQTGEWPYSTVSQNACRSCHRSHTAGGHERLLIFEKEEDNCLSCHDGLVASTNIMAELDKFTSHDPRNYLDRHDPVEVPSTSQAHVECADCHNPHAVQPSTGEIGYVPIGPALTGAAGITIGGAPIREAQLEYEVCLRCHGDSPVPVGRRIGRQADTPNFRLKFSSFNPSYHPVVISTSNTDTVSLIPTLSPGSMIRCTDCHNNDKGPRAGGSGPDGPHGSSYDFLLERNYTVTDGNVESEYEYAICYKCHERSSILGDESFKEHKKHIEEEDTPCSACHDPHGVTLATGDTSDHTHLINFDMTIVRPVSVTEPVVFRDLGRFSGSCTLVCHGEEHRDERYERD